MKRYCQTLELYNDPELIEQYEREHQRVWPEIKARIKEVGILDMQIYRLENILFMIVDTVDEFDWIEDNKRLATLPRQAEGRNTCQSFRYRRRGKPRTRNGK